MTRMPRLVLASLAGLALAANVSATADPPATKDTERVVTSLTVLVGFPSGDSVASTGVLLVPGTVIPVTPDRDPAELADQPIVVRESLAFTRVVDRLWRTFRLDPKRQIQMGRYVVAAVGQTIDLPAPEDANVSLTAQLLGFDASVATYRVVFRQGADTLADSTVNVKRGERAVIGGMDGEAAPYVFVIVEPDPPAGRPVPMDEQAGISEPVSVNKVYPVYPKAAKKEGAQGIVTLSATIDAQGRPRDLRVLHGPDTRLSDAALEAARQWLWEPARTAEGEPIAVYLTLTFNFRLQ